VKKRGIFEGLILTFKYLLRNVQLVNWAYIRLKHGNIVWKRRGRREKQPMIAAAHNQKDFGTSAVNSLSWTNPEARDIRVGGHYRTDCLLKF